MAKTAAEMKHRAGRYLGIVKKPEALRSDHDTILTESYSVVYDQLKDEGLAVWAYTGSMPDKVMNHVAALVAFDCVDDLGRSEERYRRVLSRRNIAMPEIRRLLTPKQESTEDPTDY